MEICSREACTGCLACLNVCPVNAIEQKTDEKGFAIPVVDDSRCIQCGLCIKTCPSRFPPLPLQSPHGIQPIAYAAWHRDLKTRRASSSGGLFSALAATVLREGGVVFGAAYDDSLAVKHCYIESEEELPRLRKSKYVQSDIGLTFRQVKRFLENNRVVLFSGTPCQIAGLKSYFLSNCLDLQNLITVDIVCHGVPSPAVFSAYLNYLEQTKGFRVEAFSFRDKIFGWMHSNVVAKGTDGAVPKKYIGTTFQDPYFVGFNRDIFLRSSCHACQYTKHERNSDITLGDFWGYKPPWFSLSHMFYKWKGVSVVVINSEKGMDLLEKLSGSVFTRAVPLEMAYRGNRPFSSSFPQSPLSDAFWNDFSSKPFSELVPKYMAPQKVSFDLYWYSTHRPWPHNMALVFLYKCFRKIKHIIESKK